jgi:hypothetical protein
LSDRFGAKHLTASSLFLPVNLGSSSFKVMVGYRLYAGVEICDLHTPKRSLTPDDALDTDAGFTIGPVPYLRQVKSPLDRFTYDVVFSDGAEFVRYWF